MEIWNSIEIVQLCKANGGYKLLRRTLHSNLCDYFSDYLVILSVPGVVDFMFIKVRHPILMK